MPFGPGFKSEAHRERFYEQARPYALGGPQTRICGARLRTGGVCTQLALEGEARCLRHCGPDAARRFRERQKADLERGVVTPEQWARAEERRARNALTRAWRKDPRLPGRTIDLGPDEAAFAASAAALGLDVDALWPGLADWLRWRWRRHQKDRPDAARWRRAVLDELPRRRAAAELTVQCVDLGVPDGRTKAARAVRAALRGGGGTERAKAVLDALRLAAACSPARGARHQKKGQPPAGPMTRRPVRPWTADPAAGGWKRRLPDRPKAPKPPSGPPRPVGRPRRLPDSPTELSALGEVLRAAGAEVRAMFEAIPGTGDRLRFLRDLADYVKAPHDAWARHRWMGWVTAAR
jgi:hypothetical protein